MNSSLYLGLMSGTSLDGVDIALTEISDDSHALRCLVFDTIPYPADLKDELHALNLSTEVSLHTLAKLQSELGQLYSDNINRFLKKNDLTNHHIKAIGSHGQTIFHDPSVSMSIQIGHPAFIAKQTGIKTVADFRIDDMANGGQGAPLAPAFHKTLFQQNNERLAVVNLGGIANVSLLSENGNVIGADTGPANGLMDEICQQHLGINYDENGAIAASQNPDQTLLMKMLAEPYFAKPFPKSTGRDLFNLNWLNQFNTSHLSTEVLISTLNQLTVETLANAIRSFDVEKVILSGGGAENSTLKNRLQTALNVEVLTAFDYDVNPHAIEAMMMAWLAHQRLNEQPVELQSITGASKASILGGVWLP